MILSLFVIASSVVFRFFHWNNILVLNFHTLSVLSDIFIGSFFAYVSFTSSKFLNFFKNLNREIIIGIYFFLGIIVYKRDLLFSGPILTAFERVIFALFFIFIIMEQNFSEKSVYKMTNFKTISSLGKYTYSLYCLHLIVIIFMLAIFKRLHLNVAYTLNYILFLTVSFLTSLGASYISYNLIEKYFLKLKRRIT